MTLQIVYQSVAAPGLGADELVEIIRRSQLRNQREGISGALLTHGRHFLQLIEGPEPAVRALYERIVRDPRHTQIELLHEGWLPEAVFPFWAMALSAYCGGLEAAISPRTQAEVFVLPEADIIQAWNSLPEPLPALLERFLALDCDPAAAIGASEG